MSWSVSNPESRTNTSPCSVGFIVPASTLRYGSIFMRLTLKPLACSMVPIDAEAIPLPTPDMTPPMTKIYLCFCISKLTTYYQLQKESNLPLFVVGSQLSVKYEGICVPPGNSKPRQVRHPTRR